MIITCPLLIGSERKREPAIVDPTPDLLKGKVMIRWEKVLKSFKVAYERHFEVFLDIYLIFRLP